MRDPFVTLEKFSKAPLSAFNEKAPAKINLTLCVVGRRADGYHELESLVAFAGIADTLTLTPDTLIKLEISGPFADACARATDNLVLKAAAALQKRLVVLTAGRFQLEKNLPVAAGLGGGSADAAAALRLLARINRLPLDDPRLAAAALATGADVPVCLDPRARIMRGLGELLSASLPLPQIPALLVNPGVPLQTRTVFAAFADAMSSDGHHDTVPEETEALIDFLSDHDNDLTPAAIACAPVIADVLAALRAQPGVRLVRMSGSGPTCFALFSSAAEATAAAARVKATRGDWWVQSTTIG